MRARTLPGDPMLGLLTDLLRLEPRRRREVGELLIELQLRDVGEVSAAQLQALVATFHECSRTDWHRSWDSSVGEILGSGQADLANIDCTGDQDERAGGEDAALEAARGRGTR